MKVIMMCVLLGVVIMAAASPSQIFDFEGDDAEHEQEGQPGSSVMGEYMWESPEGLEFVVKYIADDKGYRILESNAVPASNGVQASGNQADLDGDEDEEADDM